MTNIKKFAPVLLMVTSSALWAQSRELWFSAGRSILGFPYFHTNRELRSPDTSGQSSDVQLDDGLRVGFRLSFNSVGSFGHEIQYMYNRSNFVDRRGAVLGGGRSAGMAIHQGGYNLLYYFAQEGATTRPFVTLGVHFNNFVLPGSAAAAQGSSTKFGFNYGIGLKFKITSLFGLRGDLRGHETGKPDWGGLRLHQGGLLHQMEASAGLGIYF